MRKGGIGKTLGEAGSEGGHGKRSARTDDHRGHSSGFPRRERDMIGNVHGGRWHFFLCLGSFRRKRCFWNRSDAFEKGKGKKGTREQEKRSRRVHPFAGTFPVLLFEKEKAGVFALKNKTTEGLGKRVPILSVWRPISERTTIFFTQRYPSHGWVVSKRKGVYTTKGHMFLCFVKPKTTNRHTLLFLSLNLFVPV
mmetsp:Transcript_11474/g.30440  ORF Transcript_11474/g.30440 Transcript_11474/m.30440 type:complete len:195 (-) Transcript_11474:3648-4232(-)